MLPFVSCWLLGVEVQVVLVSPDLLQLEPYICKLHLKTVPTDVPQFTCYDCLQSVISPPPPHLWTQWLYHMIGQGPGRTDVFSCLFFISFMFCLTLVRHIVCSLDRLQQFAFPGMISVIISGNIIISSMTITCNIYHSLKTNIEYIFCTRENLQTMSLFQCLQCNCWSPPCQPVSVQSYCMG